MKKKVFILIILIIAVILAFVLFFSGKPGDDNEKECSNDEDCVKQLTTCCPCSAGGQEVCMSKKNLTYWQNKLEECKVKNILCMQMYNCREINCKCINGKCSE